MSFPELLLISTGIAYIFFLLAVVSGILRLRRQTSLATTDTTTFLSVIVPARNEQSTIENCLQSIVRSSLPVECYEIIVVDDHSSDNTASIVKDFMEIYPQTRLLHLGDDATGKSEALNVGIASCRGDVVATIDSDCIASIDWLHLTRDAVTGEYPIVAGPVFFESDGKIFSGMQALEFLGLVAVGAGCIGIGLPTICNSANLAYRQSLPTELAPAGFGTAPGADERMLQQIRSTGLGSASFNMAPSSFVTAQPAATVREFVDQRRRWAGSVGGFAHPFGLFVSITIFVFFVLLIALTLLVFFTSTGANTIIVAWTGKVIAELAVLGVIAAHFDRLKLLRYFIPAQIVHIPYIVGVSIFSLVSGHSWKGRRHN
ncbi:MAG: glycosyltransferase [Rhodothermales bacterium]|nr:glycosyltransferase [Rhodothermales bacterium]